MAEFRLDKLTICGGGNGAQTLLPVAAANLACPVDFFAPYADEAERLSGEIELTGAIQSRARPRRASSDPAEVIPSSNLVVLVMPAFAHESTLHQIAPFLEPGAWVGAIPARSGFDYCAARVLAGHGREDVNLFGLQTLPWACRIQEFGRRVHVLGVKQGVDAASRPAAGIEQLAPLLGQMLGLPVPPAGNMLALTLANAGQLIHPGIMYSLFGRWDGVPLDEPPLFYHSLSHEGAATLAQLSDEVQQIRARMEADIDLSAVRPLKEWLLRSYGESVLDESSMWSAFRSNQAYTGLKAPVRQTAATSYVPDFAGRYLTEDVPFGLAVTRAIGALVGVATPTMDRIVAWAGERNDKEYTGRDAGGTRIPQNYGLNNVKELVEFTLKA